MIRKKLVEKLLVVGELQGVDVVRKASERQLGHQKILLVAVSRNELLSETCMSARFQQTRSP